MYSLTCSLRATQALLNKEDPTTVYQETHQQVSRCLKRAPDMNIYYSSDEDSDIKEEMVPRKKRKTALKSCKLHTADAIILKQIVWVMNLSTAPAARQQCMMTYHYFLSYRDTLRYSRLKVTTERCHVKAPQ